MPNWQERADGAKQQVDGLKQQEDALRVAKAVREQAKAQKTRDEHFKEVNGAMEQLQQLGVDNMLREINRDTRFWGGKGVVTVDPVQADEYEGKYTLRLVGEIQDVIRRIEYVTVQKFGIHEIGGISGGGEPQGGGPCTDKRLGFYTVSGEKIVGYDHYTWGPKVSVEMGYLREDPETGISRRRTQTHYFGVHILDSGAGGNFETRYDFKGPSLSTTEAKAFFDKTFLDIIQEREGQPTLSQLQQTAKEGLSGKIADINRRVGQVTESDYVQSSHAISLSAFT